MYAQDHYFIRLCVMVEIAGNGIVERDSEKRTWNKLSGLVQKSWLQQQSLCKIKTTNCVRIGKGCAYELFAHYIGWAK